MRYRTVLVVAVAASRVGRALLGIGGGGDGLIDAAFSAPDAPNSPSDWPSRGGSATSSSDSPSQRRPDSDDWLPEGWDNWLDFADWSTWTTVKNMLPGGQSLPIDLLELGPTMGETLTEVKKNNQRREELFTTDFRGDQHLRGDQ